MLCDDMTGRFDYFAVIAGMRTGSNLLEELLNAHPDLCCHGELFNPHFVGRADRQEALGISRDRREADPGAMIAAVRAGAGLHGFRIFDGHDPRALDAVLADERCAKILLTRNPLESHVSLQIARQTRQWWLGDMASARSGRVRFDTGEFAAFLTETEGFRRQVRHAIQSTGQTAFALDYEELSDDAVIAGLYRFLGCDPVPRPRRTRTKVQNPVALTEKVTNPRAMEAALARLDPFDLSRIPDFEPMRGVAAPGFRVAARVPVMFMPLAEIAVPQVDRWLADLSAGSPALSGLTQKELRAWMRDHPGHRKFTVVAHPAARIHDSFCRHILPADLPGFEDLRDLLKRRYDVPLPDDPEDPGYDAGAHKSAFLAFLRFVCGNLNGQTSVAVNAPWASQSKLLAGIGRFATPDLVIRQEALGKSLERLAEDLAPGETPAVIPSPPPKVPLEAIHDTEVETAIRRAYRRDYDVFGFGDWR